MVKRLLLALFFSLVITHSTQAGFIPNEARIGILKHDVKSRFKHSYEKGYDINLETLWKTPEYIFFTKIFSPRPHIGASINTDKGTDQFYLGLTWRLDFFKYLFIEGTFGGEIHTGRLNKQTKHKQNLGSRLLFRESISLGYQFLENNSISIILDHASNASLAEKNSGLTNLGLRYGYSF